MSAYELNRMMYDLRRPENREALKADLESYLARYGITEPEKQLVRDGDWQGLVEAGVSVYVLTKIGAALDVSLLQMGAQMRGESLPDFLDFIRRQNERVAAFALLTGSGAGSGGGERG